MKKTIALIEAARKRLSKLFEDPSLDSSKEALVSGHLSCALYDLREDGKPTPKPFGE